MSYKPVLSVLCGVLVLASLHGRAAGKPITKSRGDTTPAPKSATPAKTRGDQGAIAPVGGDPIVLPAPSSDAAAPVTAPSSQPSAPAPSPAAPTAASKATSASSSTPEQPLSSAGSDDLVELRRFEESAFPRTGESSVRPSETPLSNREGRPTADSPTPGIHSDPHAAPVEAPQAAPDPWLAKLALPDLPVRWDPKLVRYLEFYRQSPKGRAIMTTWLRRMGRYQKLISEALHRQHLPQSLIYLAMIESGYNPKVTSRAGAAGIWQFMAGPGRGYGLHRDHWVDERRNPERSTEAALRYLKDLHDRFGSWDLALASYNAGYGGVTRSIQKYNTNDYWQICRYEAGLPWETVLYVPKILAAAIVGSNRTLFGFDGITPDPEVATTLVSVPASISLAQAASLIGVSHDLMEQLNPELRRGRTPPGKSWLRVPKESESRFYAGLANIQGQLARYKPYVVRLGETVKDLAAAFGLSAVALRSLNGLEQAADLRPGLTILVPARAPAASRPAVATSDPEEPMLVPLPGDKPTEVPGRRRVFYRTVIGDSLDEIATHLRVSVVELADWNALDRGAKLVSGMVLQAFVPPSLDLASAVLLDAKRLRVMVAGSDEFYSAYEERKGRRRISYAIRDGDTVQAIARRFGLSVGSVIRINRLDRRASLRPGQTLVLYVEQARLRNKDPGRAKGKRPSSESARAAEEDDPRETEEQAVSKADPPAGAADEGRSSKAVEPAGGADNGEQASGSIESDSPPATKRSDRKSHARPAKRSNRASTVESTEAPEENAGG